mgnify:CR=1 FL=1
MNDGARLALTNLTFEELQAWVVSLGEPAYRAQQIRQWLYQELAQSFVEMTTLPLSLRQRLAEAATISAVQPQASLTSSDGLTEKVLLALPDGSTIESVLMLYEGRQTVCVSTQVGCPIRCIFCATGRSGYVRNLTAGEIVDQVLYFARQLKGRGLQVTNVVVMGMGEPFLNYAATWQALTTLHDPKGFALGARHMTISTAGIVPGIERMAKEPLQVGLAVSLHAPNDALRNQLVPINRKYPLGTLIPACQRYTEEMGRRITFEYALIDGVNDSPPLARELATLLKGMLCHVNLIPCNPGSGGECRPSSRQRVLAFQKQLKQAGIPNTLRVGRGIEIQAGCGELRSRAASEYVAGALDVSV